MVARHRNVESQRTVAKTPEPERPLEAAAPVASSARAPSLASCFFAAAGDRRIFSSPATAPVIGARRWLAYVAATRARDVLVIPAVGDEIYEGGWLDPLMPAN
jgi:hypothetical protein